MDTKMREKFIGLWGKYFNAAELPIIFYYTDEPIDAEEVQPSSGHRCIFADLARVRKGACLCFGVESIGCFGGKRCLGFSLGARDKISAKNTLFITSDMLRCGQLNRFLTVNCLRPFTEYPAGFMKVLRDC